MSAGGLSSWAVPGSGGAILGLVFGLLQFAALRRTIELYRAGCRIAPSALTLARLGGAVVFFGLVARLGAVSLLSAFLGFLLARSAVLRAWRSVA
jgi:hypothetical protein